MTKLQAITILILSSTASLFAQTKFDENVSVAIPGKVQTLDTVMKNMTVKIHYFNNETESYAAQRILMDTMQDYLNNLPSDLKNLREYYSGVVDGSVKSMKKNGFGLRASKEVRIGKYIGWNASYYNLKTGSKISEFNYLILNEYLYSFSYSNISNFNENNKNKFLNSIKVNSSKNIQQMAGNSREYKLGYIAGTIFGYGIFIVGIIFLIRYFRKK